MSLDRWLAIGGLAVGVLSIPIAILIARYYYRRSDKKRVPTFVVDSRTSLTDSSLTTSATNLAVLCDGVQVGERGITRAIIYFWNSGTLAVKSDDVLTPYSITLPVPILAYEIKKVSREVTHLSIEKRADKQLVLSFSVLEEGDGCTINVVFDGPPSTGIEFDGASLEAPKPKVLPASRWYSLPKSKRLREAYSFLLALPIFAIAMLVVMGLILGAFAGAAFVLNKFFGNAAAHRIGVIAAWVFFGAFGVFAIGANVWPRVRGINAPYLPPDVKD